MKVINQADFYNEEDKFKYLETVSHTEANTGKRLFNLSAPIEREKKKDISQFNADEVIDLYRRNNFTSLASLWAVHRQLKNYVQFITGKRNYELDTINDNVLSSVINKVIYKNKFITTDDLDEWENALRCLDTFNAQDMFILRAVYEGIGGATKQELEDLTLDNFSIVNGKYYVDIKGEVDKHLEVSKELYDLAVESNDIYVYKCSGRTMSNGSTTIVSKPMCGDTIIKRPDRSNSNNENMVNRITKRFIKIRKILDIQYLTLKNIELSGMIKRIQDEAILHQMNVADYMYDPQYCNDVMYIMKCYNKYSKDTFTRLRRQIVQLLQNV